MDTKVCTKCGIKKPLDQFYKDKKKKDWYHSCCKSCKNIVNKKYIDNNNLIIKQKAKKYREEHKEHIKEKNKNWYWNNRDKALENNRQYKIDHPDYSKKMYYKHRDKYIQNSKDRQKKMWYTKLHSVTYSFIKKHNLYPDECCLCWSNKSIEAHHPDYSKWYEVIFICHKCHQNIHAWNINCPKPINLLDLVPPFNSNNNSEEWE